MDDIEKDVKAVMAEVIALSAKLSELRKNTPAAADELTSAGRAVDAVAENLAMALKAKRGS